MPNHRKPSDYITDHQARNQLGAHGHAKALGVPLGELTLKTKRVAKQALRCAAPNGGSYVETHYDTKNILAYCLKGLAPDSELAHLLTDNSLTGKRQKPTPWKPEYQGAIEGLRCRVSDNIGWTARARHDGEVIPFPDLEGLAPLPANFGLSALSS